MLEEAWPQSLLEEIGRGAELAALHCKVALWVALWLLFTSVLKKQDFLHVCSKTTGCASVLNEIFSARLTETMD